MATKYKRIGARVSKVQAYLPPLRQDDLPCAAIRRHVMARRDRHVRDWREKLEAADVKWRTQLKD